MASHLVLDSARYITERALDVSVSLEGVESLAKKFIEIHGNGQFSLSNWTDLNILNPKPFVVGAEAALAWIFVVDTLNFCFWSPDADLFTVTYKTVPYDGYLSLCAVVNRAIDEGIPITDPEYLRDLTLEQATHLFRSDNHVPVPQFNMRVNVLKELGAVISSTFEGKWTRPIELAGKSAAALVDLVVQHIPSFDDKCQFDSKTVYFRKRAQILVADIWACFRNEGFGRFTDIDFITMFADYRVPQSLAYFGVIKYSDSLLNILMKDPFLPKSGRLECEIRGVSIWSVELIVRKFHEILLSSSEFAYMVDRPFNAIMVDFYLWDYAKLHAADLRHVPIHKTLTHFY